MHVDCQQILITYNNPMSVHHFLPQIIIMAGISITAFVSAKLSFIFLYINPVPYCIWDSNIPANFDHVSAFETVYFWPELKKCFSEVNRVLKDGGTFLICNESDGMNASDDKWTKIIDGMKIYNCDQLITALKEAGFMEIKPYADAKNHWLCIVATK